MKPMKIPTLTCLRCGHGTPEQPWYPRKPTLPTCCPKCKSPYWSKPRRHSLPSQEDPHA